MARYSLVFKKINNKCNNIVKISKESYFQENISEGSVSSKSFWNSDKHFICSKETLLNENLITEAPDQYP